MQRRPFDFALQEVRTKTAKRSMTDSFHGLLWFMLSAHPLKLLATSLLKTMRYKQKKKEKHMLLKACHGTRNTNYTKPRRLIVKMANLSLLT